MQNCIVATGNPIRLQGRNAKPARSIEKYYGRSQVAFCGSCPDYQKVAPRLPPQAPLVPLPIIETPFQRIGMDLVGPLDKSARGHKYILVFVDYATRYPEAIPLWVASATNVATALLSLISRVGIPKEILTDQGTPFMSKVMQHLCALLRFKALRTSIYHLQTGGLVERFNQVLKQMLKQVVRQDGRDWDLLLPYLLFAIWEVPQASTGFSPFELLYTCQPRGLLDVVRETWESPPPPTLTLVEYVTGMKERMEKISSIVKEHLQAAQMRQEAGYNIGAQLREFKKGDRVLIMIPTAESKFLARWQGPYEIAEKINSVNYRVYQPGKRKPFQTYHLNLLKPWKDREVLWITTEDKEADLGPVAPMKAESKVMPTISEALTPTQRGQVLQLLRKHQRVFSTQPGRTTTITHNIDTKPSKRVCIRQYHIPEAKQVVVREEVQKMLQLGVIEESRSGWNNPIVLVPKPDGSLWFCNDFRHLNAISKFDAYLVPQVDDLIEKLGTVRYLTTLDLTKGYWQVPLTPRAKEKTTFSTPDGLFQYTVLPFGLHGAPATFQRLMNQLLRPHRAYAVAYLDDIVIFSPDWESHLLKVGAVLRTFGQAGLTASPAKCKIGM
nr:PREDICTED: uncharacterized protein LOC102354893 [Latimeria chalumnae]|eukprot:XP_014351057.1 PREDICTED: uncharacterized protein LOC102354893 [Latimeria chalumnae]